jgi:short-subunit dehydrogenase
MKNVVIFGAASAIAHRTAVRFAQDNANLFLIARDMEKLEAVKNDILTRFETNIELLTLDANDIEKHSGFLNELKEKAGKIDVFLIAHGTLPDQEKIQDSPEKIIDEYKTNALSVFSLATIMGNIMEEQGEGTIAVISSVAGDRGRMSNYIYGSAKAAVSAFTQGLRNRLYHKGVHVVTIKPGFVDTPMTKDTKKNFLFASAKDVGEGIYKAIEEKKNVAYLPKFWSFIMCVIRSIPESIFKKMKM